PSNLVYVPGDAVYAVATAIDTNKATVTGVVDSFTVAPALPAGLSLNALTGAITGTPTLAAASAQYVVSAHNVSGNTKDTLTLQVLEQAPIVSYASPKIFTVGLMVPELAPASIGGPVTGYSVSPNLTTATGLSFSAT